MPEELEREKIEEQKKKEQPKDIEKQKEEVAQAYGIKLSDIEHVRLENGKEFFKFYNPKNRQVKMIENRDYNNGISEQFKSIQQELSFTQSKDEKDNANAIYDYNSAHKNIELALIPMQELKSNKYKYMRQINALSTIDRKKVKALIKSSKQLGLQYINLENAIGIDGNYNVIDVTYDFGTNTAVIKNAKVLNYQDQIELNDNEEINIEISAEEFNNIVSSIEINENGPVLSSSDKINIHGEVIDGKTLNDYFNMPEAIDKLEVSNKRRFIIHGIIRALERRMALKKENTLEKEKIKILTNKNNQGAAA